MAQKNFTPIIIRLYGNDEDDVFIRNELRKRTVGKKHGALSSLVKTILIDHFQDGAPPEKKSPPPHEAKEKKETETEQRGVTPVTPAPVPVCQYDEEGVDKVMRNLEELSDFLS